MRSETLNEQEYDQELERLVDVRNLSYDEARAVLGPPPYEILAANIPVEALALRALHAWSRQRVINKAGIEKVRAAYRRGLSAVA